MNLPPVTMDSTLHGIHLNSADENPDCFFLISPHCSSIYDPHDCFGDPCCFFLFEFRAPRNFSFLSFLCFRFWCFSTVFYLSNSIEFLFFRNSLKFRPTNTILYFPVLFLMYSSHPPGIYIFYIS